VAAHAGTDDRDSGVHRVVWVPRAGGGVDVRRRGGVSGAAVVSSHGSVTAKSRSRQELHADVQREAGPARLVEWPNRNGLHFEVEFRTSTRRVRNAVVQGGQQPSETDEYLLARVLAYCLEFKEGIAFHADSPNRMSRRSPCAI